MTKATALLCGLFLLVQGALATPEFVEHSATNAVFGESGVTMRNPAGLREGDAADLWVRIGYSFFYTDVAIYYTTDGSTPLGTKGVGSGTTTVLKSSSGQITFVRNESTGGGQVDWWKGTLPAAIQVYGRQVKYKIGAWHSSGGIEVFSDNFGCSDNTCNDPSNTAKVSSYRVGIAWPGQGSAFVNHTVGYPPYHSWKEEAVAGNNYMNVMLDRNGSVYDIYYPSAGAVQGVASKNEGYSDGVDTFPAGLPPTSRGQLNLNQAFAGLRAGGKTYWLTNSAGTDYVDWEHRYIEDSQTVYTKSRFVAGGRNIQVEQYDFAPKGITFPLDATSQPNRGIYFKRMLLKNNGASAQTIDVFYYMDPALNGGDNHDGMFADSSRGAMVAYDNTFRLASSVSEYNPSSFSDYSKNVSLYLASSMKVVNTVGGASGTFASDSWRDSSSDNGQGWIGSRITLNPGETREVNIATVGGFDNFAGATGTYTSQIQPVLDWFQTVNVSNLQVDTDNYWLNWLAQGTTIDYPDDSYDALFKRGLLGTALHQDGKSGALVAGMHNGAYMYCWPRDAVWAAVTLDRVGQNESAREIYRFLKDVAFRSNESWGGKGFFYQKYTTDGYTIWSAPQVDETAVVPWGVKYHYDSTGDLPWLSAQYDSMVYDSARASSEDSSIDSRMYYADSVKLMYSMSLWEDAFDVFVYSNANVIRGLWDAAWIANVLNKPSDVSLFNSRASNIYDGMVARMDWNGENTDISQLGVVYPFRVLSPTDNRMKLVVDRMNGVANDRFGNKHPIMNFSGEFEGMVNRYWGDSYWGGGPWTLSTLWYGMYYGMRADYTAGTGDIDNMKLRIDKAKQFNTSVNFGAEQYSPSYSLLYAGQPDYRHQAAWPNAWESMSFYVDSMMGFLDFVPDARLNTLRISPKLPSTWNSLRWKNVQFGPHSFDIEARNEGTTRVAQFITNKSGLACNLGTWLRLPTGYKPLRIRRNGQTLKTFTYEASTNRVNIQTSLNTGVGALTVVDVILTPVGGGKTEGGTKDPYLP
ncbi:MAG: hypothetical protein JNM85_10480 [Chthonomonas sp.]|nr:hypothetical protein [Chthonomonas sp.]